MGLLVISIAFLVLAYGAHGEKVPGEVDVSVFDAAENITDTNATTTTKSNTRSSKNPVNLPAPTVKNPDSPNTPIQSDGIPTDTFRGTDKATLACVKPRIKSLLFHIAELIGLQIPSYLQFEYAETVITGQWQFQGCSYGFVKSFHTSSKQYKDALKTCKDKGYVTAQPSIGGQWTYASEGFPFQVGDYYMPYYPNYADQDNPPKHFPAAIVPSCSPARNTTALPNDYFPDTSNEVEVYCAKRSPGRLTDAASEKLSVPNVKGKWTSYRCQFGAMKYFRVSTAWYKNAFEKCRDKGYDTVQPYSNKNKNHWYPFMVGGVLTEFYYKAIYAQDMELYPQATIPFKKCVEAVLK